MTLRVLGTPLRARSDDQGRISIGRSAAQDVPVGTVHLQVDGSTATRPGEWASLIFELNVVAGQDNSFTGPIYILPLDTENSRVVGGDQDVVLRMAGVAEFSLTVFARSVTFPDGSRTGRATVTQVKQDKIPMPLPGGSVFPLAWTIQPPGIRFNPPAAVTVPNNTGLGPGASVEIFSFDHDISEFLAVATGTVSADGSMVISDPGQGISKGGWGGAGPPPPPQTCVTKAVMEILASPALASIVLPPGGERHLRALIRPEDCRVDGRQIRWSVNDPRISLNPGLGEQTTITVPTPLGDFEADIIASAAGISATLRVKFSNCGKAEIAVTVMSDPPTSDGTAVNVTFTGPFFLGLPVATLVKDKEEFKAEVAAPGTYTAKVHLFPDSPLLGQPVFFDMRSVDVPSDPTNPLCPLPGKYIFLPVRFSSGKNHEPTATAPDIVIFEDTEGTSQISVNDPDPGQAHTFTMAIPPTNGTARVDAGGLVTYTPFVNFNGSDNLVVKVSDNGVPPLSNNVRIGITVTPVNDPPVANNATLTVIENTPASGTLSASDVEGDSLTFSIVRNGAKGTPIVTNSLTGAYTYIPNPGMSGADSFTFRVNDGRANSPEATVSITILPR